MNRNNEKYKEVLGKVLFLFISVIFIGIGLISIVQSYMTNRTIRESKLWPVTTGEVTNNKIRESYDGERTTYYPEITYAYTVSGVEYTCEIRLNVSSSRSNDEDIVNTLESFPNGSIVKVSYNPARPQVCVSEYDERNVFSFLPWAFIFFPLLLIYMIFKKHNK